MSVAWNGRFTEETNKKVQLFTASIDIDIRLYKYDIAGSIAHSQMLAKTNIITVDEAQKIVVGLKEIENEIEAGQFKILDSLEDIHIHIESRLFEKIGETARKLHTARSRNDQIALDLKLCVKEETTNTMKLLLLLMDRLIFLAEQNIEVIMPGYTHLQKAQPVLFSHHLMAYLEMFKRDYQRFNDSIKRVDIMPLGSAALAGTSYNIDRFGVKDLLGFKEVSKNSMDSVADRDFIIEFISNASILMAHLSRLSEEMILWSSLEFNFIEISDAFTTGSSIMPQKKNPDIAELVRGKTGKVYGSLINILTIMKGLPLTYNRDMQEDKTPLFDTIDTIQSSLEIYIEMLPNIKVNKDKMRQAASFGYLNATDLADYLAKKNIPFRDAHHITGKIVAYAISQKKELNELSLKELKNFSNLIENDIFKILELNEVVSARTSYGGTSKDNVIKAIEEAKNELKNYI